MYTLLQFMHDYFSQIRYVLIHTVTRAYLMFAAMIALRECSSAWQDQGTQPRIYCTYWVCIWYVCMYVYSNSTY
jgi:hypothetical protein